MGEIIVVNETMVTPPTTGSILNNAFWDSAGYLILTQAIGGENGEFDYNQNLSFNLNITFDFWTGGGSGADAVYFYWGTNNAASDEDGNSTSAGGYIVAYDEYVGDSGSYQISYGTTRLATAGAPGGADFSNSTWHTANIVVSGNVIYQYLDNILKNSYTDINRILPGSHFGWGSRTGGLTNEHRVRNLFLAESPSMMHAPANGEANISLANPTQPDSQLSLQSSTNGFSGDNLLSPTSGSSTS